MRPQSRRGFLGLAAAGVAGLVLRADAQETPASGAVGDYAAYAGEPLPAATVKPAAWAATEGNILGPFYREGAPFRGKVTPPLAPGRALLIQGRVWALDTRRPLPHAVLDVWQANHEGRYDNDEQQNPPRKDVFLNRARLVTDEQGRYEYETIFPGKYKIGPAQWRPAHIHYLVRASGYRQLVTQLYFRGDPHNEADVFIKPSLIIELKEEKTGQQAFDVGNFDIVLAPQN